MVEAPSYQPGLLTCRNRLGSSGRLCNHHLVTTRLGFHHHYHLSPLRVTRTSFHLGIAFLDCFSIPQKSYAIGPLPLLISLQHVRVIAYRRETIFEV